MAKPWAYSVTVPGAEHKNLGRPHVEAAMRGIKGVGVIRDPQGKTLATYKNGRWV